MTRKEERESRIKVIIEQRRTCQGRKETGGWYYKDWWLNGAEWADKTFLQKACEFLDGCIPDYIDLKHANVDTFMNVDNKRFIDDFRNYMKGEEV